MSNHLLKPDSPAALIPAEAEIPRPAQLPALTSIRFLLALSVLCYHYNSNFPSNNSIPPFLITVGSALAVPAFFCLSGFVLTYQYQNVDLDRERARYWFARAARILPVYWLCLALSLIFTPRIGLYPDLNKLLPVWLINVFLLQAWVPDKNIYWAFDPPAYTLSIETFLYLVFPFFVTRIWKKKWLTLGITLCAVFGLQKLISMSSAVDIIWRDIICPVGHVWQFLLGVGAGAVYVKFRDACQRKTWLTSPAVFSLMELATLLVTTQAGNATLSLLGFAGLIYVCAFEKGVCSRMLSCRPLVTLGGMSYASYLLHYLFIFWLVYNRLDASKVSGPASFAIFLACTLSASFVIFKSVEQPLRRKIVHLGDLMMRKWSRKESRLTNGALLEKPTLNPILKAFVVLLAFCALFRLAALTPWIRSSCEIVEEAFMRPVTGSENIDFGDSCTLLKTYIYQGLDGLVVTTFWSQGANSQEGKILGVHLLDHNNRIVGQCDHPLGSGPVRVGQKWRDSFIVPASTAAKAEKIGFVIYENPSKCWLVRGGNCDWEQHRLLLVW